MNREHPLDSGEHRHDDPILTWAALLAYWARLARASLALPASAEGDRWRRAIPAIIGLQAIACALRHAGGLPPEELAVAHDRSSVQIEACSDQLAALWAGEPLHPELIALVDDARAALRDLRGATRGSSPRSGP